MAKRRVSVWTIGASKFGGLVENPLELNWQEFRAFCLKVFHFLGNIKKRSTGFDSCGAFLFFSCFSIKKY